MSDVDPFEPGSHSFSGTVRGWTNEYAEFVTDSGLVLFLDTRGQAPVPQGTRLRIEARKYRPCYVVTRMGPG